MGIGGWSTAQQPGPGALGSLVPGCLGDRQRMCSLDRLTPLSPASSWTLSPQLGLWTLLGVSDLPQSRDQGLAFSKGACYVVRLWPCEAEGVWTCLGGHVLWPHCIPSLEFFSQIPWTSCSWVWSEAEDLSCRTHGSLQQDVRAWPWAGAHDVPRGSTVCKTGDPGACGPLGRYTLAHRDS